MCVETKNFSVSMCVYGGDNAEYFEAAVNSIVMQTVLPREIVLVVDGPIPETIENVISKLDSDLLDLNVSFKKIYLEKNLGHGDARRICFENCSCPLIALMDADDISVPDRFEKQISFFRYHPNVSVVGGQIKEFFSASNPTDISHFAGSRIVPEDDDQIKKYMKKRCPMNQVTVMFKKDDVAEVGGYIDWYCEEDYYLWIRLAIAGKKFGNVNENLVNVRVGDEMYQRRGGWKYFKSEAKLQKYMLSNGMINSLRYLINVCERLLLQVLMPNKLRGWIFQKLARTN